jgi:hypothetical protein
VGTALRAFATLRSLTAREPSRRQIRQQRHHIEYGQLGRFIVHHQSTQSDNLPLA